MFLIDLGVQAALYACKYFLKRIGLFLWTEFCRYHNKKFLSYPNQNTAAD